MLSFKHAWHPYQIMKIKVFQWKMLHGILPITDRLARFNMVLRPSICPLCRKHEDSMDHVFISCTVVTPVWYYFQSILGITLCSTTDMRQMMMHWWLKAGSKTLLDLFKHFCQV
ncbi:unnamed protein product [Cuscuta epithymum]|nr:unnamed protein product [Cuscuta epithymum]